jgi:hypothetical protein
MREEWIHHYIAEHDVPVNLLLKKGYIYVGSNQRDATLHGKISNLGQGAGAAAKDAALTKGLST